MDKRRLVRQYVQRQRAFLHTYTAQHPPDERPGTPPSQTQCDQFGFDTPVLRPRVPAKTARDAPSTPEDDRAARLAGRRERKRRKRAIVNPPQNHDEVGARVAPSKAGRTSAQKTKKPAALALLYGFSATNVTKDRLTVKPAPSLGVFSKGKASVKKKVRCSSRNEIFSELAFLNKSTEQTADNPNDDLVSSISDRAAKRRKKEGGKRAETRALMRTPAESEVWDIEVQSKLPSSARGVSNEPGANDSASVILNLCGAEWSASLHAAGEHEERHLSPRTRSTGSVVHSGLRDAPHPADEAPSIHPSHSASQMGRHAADIPLSDLWRPERSRYLTHSEPATVHQFAAEAVHESRSNDSLDVLNSRIPDQDGAMEEQTTILRATWPTSSSISGVQPLAEFRSQCDVAPLEFPSDCSPYDDWYTRADGVLEDDGYFEPFVQGGPAYHDVEDPLDMCPFQCCASPDDVAYDLVQDPTAEYDNDPIAVEDDDDDDDDNDDNEEEGMPEFLQGRALLYGVSDQWPRLSGLAQAERDVAGQLRDHWRPLRLS